MVIQRIKVFWRYYDNNFRLDKYLSDENLKLIILCSGGNPRKFLTVVEYFWDSSLSKIGELTQKRSNIVKNDHLAIIYDRWQLYEHRIKRLQEGTTAPNDSDKIIHEKGTLVEAIFGVIYVEMGFDEVIRVVPSIQ